MFKYFITFLFLFLNLIFLGSCSNLKKGIGLEKDTPNEFLIEKKNPLVFPPNYKLLPPESIKTKIDNKQTDTSLQSIFDQKTNTQNTKSDNPNNKSLELEKEILDQIK